MLGWLQLDVSADTTDPFFQKSCSSWKPLIVSDSEEYGKTKVTFRSESIASRVFAQPFPWRFQQVFVMMMSRLSSCSLMSVLPLFLLIAIATARVADDKWNFNVPHSCSMSLANMTDLTQWGYSGVATFGHLPHLTCLTREEENFDIAIIGAPFDTAVSYRPGTWDI